MEEEFKSPYVSSGFWRALGSINQYRTNNFITNWVERHDLDDDENNFMQFNNEEGYLDELVSSLTVYNG